jgi:hypothetical protein
MEIKQQEILILLDKYEKLTQEAKALGVTSTKNVLGDLIESLVCNQIGAKKCPNNSQKGYDAKRDSSKIQIKFRSINKSRKYKITFKNVKENCLGFNVLAFCSKTTKGYNIYEI